MISDLTSGMEADAPGIPCSDALIRWLNSLPQDLLSVLDTLAGEGHGAWLVGGAVRDATMGVGVGDIDICTTSKPEQTMALFGNRAIATGIQFGTVTVKGDQQNFEVTTLRTESLYRDGRHPEKIEWGMSLKEDLSRRDFTFNSMAIDVARAMLYDPYDGLDDIAQKTVRAVGNPLLRCEEDGLRILRAYRFLDRGGEHAWSFTPSLHRAILQKRAMLERVSVERVWQEFQKIMMGRHAGQVVSFMHEDGVLSIILAKKCSIDLNVIKCMGEIQWSGWHLHHRLALLFVEQTTQEVEEIMRHLKASNEQRIALLKFHRTLISVPDETLANLRVFRHCLGDDAPYHLELHATIAGAPIHIHGHQEKQSDSIHALVGRLSVLKPLQAGDDCLVDGHWLMERTGLEKGARLGRLKQWVHRLQVERDAKTQNEIEQWLSILPWSHGDEKHWPRLNFP